MTVKEYLNHFNKMVKDHPEIENLDICYSMDDEGNCFYPVNFTPSVGIKDSDDFDTLKKFKDWKNANAVCIN
jgi:hypothetical protein